jgi:hypothetical protein
MRELLRRLWLEITYDPMVEYQRAKDLLARRLAAPAADDREARKARLRLLGSESSPED